MNDTVTNRYLVGGLLTLLILPAVAVIGFSIVYAGKIYPGVQLSQVSVGGMSQPQASAALAQAAIKFQTEQIPVEYNRTILGIPVKSLSPNYSQAGVQAAMNYGRQGSLAQQLRARFRLMLGRQATFGSVTYDDSRLTPFLQQIDDDVTQSVANAQLTFQNGGISVTPSQPGHRVDRGLLTLKLGQQLAQMDKSTLKADVYLITPTIDEDTLRAARHQADAYVSAPVTLTAAGQTQNIDQNQILSWLDVTTTAGKTDLPLDPLRSFYHNVDNPNVKLSLDQNRVGAYVAGLAKQVNQDPQNAALAMQNGQLTVVQPSKDGVALDQAKAQQQITAAITKPVGERDIKLAATTKPADVNEHNLDQLGIKDQISEGETFFPGSPAARMTNIRVGAARFNGVLVKPGQVWSFDDVMGDVGPEQGYVPELVIVGNHEEKQYGGGMCQVASTAYRAALLAGLPILERTNHSFAVVYYTAPYSAPGVDATVYGPVVDLKFRNDTGHYILIQTKLQGYTLTFDFFGTKTKVGEIRGPQFVSGSNDATQPSHTVFWRDIKDLNGNLIKTDEVNTYYQSSKDFPLDKQLN